MKFAVNYSRQAADLVESGKIRIDLFKCPAMPKLIEEAQARGHCYVHFPFFAGRNQMQQVDWSEANQLLESTSTPYVNLHLGPCVSDFEGMALDTRRAADRARLIDTMQRDIEALLERFEPERIILENLLWDPEPPWQFPQPVLEPEVIEQVVVDSDCGFILDLAHASASAKHFGVEVKEYVSALPVDRLRELHVSGTRMGGTGLWQDHMPMSEEDWELLEWAMERIRAGDWPRPWAVTFEYGGVGERFESRSEERVLAEQAPRVLELVRLTPV